MTITREMTPAEQSIANQISENTGTHFLDSGGANGRHWQRNQGVDWLNTPEATFDMRWGYPTINLFHYLAARLDVDRTTRAMDRAFEAFVDADWGDGRRYGDHSQRYTNGSGTMEEFLDGVSTDGNPRFDRHCEMGGGGYTYNDENLLDQDFVYNLFAWNDQSYVAISTHNGADARGGFSDWKFYLLDDWEYFFDYGCASIHYQCDYVRPEIEAIQVDMFTNKVVGPNTPCGWTLDIRHGDQDWYNHEGYSLNYGDDMEKTETHDEDASYKCPCGRGTLRYEDVSAPNQY